MANLHELSLELLLLSPDLKTSDFLFSDLKQILAGKKFYDKEELISDAELYFEANDKWYYTKGNENLEDWIAVDGNNTEFSSKMCFFLKWYELLNLSGINRGRLFKSGNNIHNMKTILCNTFKYYFVGDNRKCSTKYLKIKLRI